MPRPSAMPPAAITGTFTASTTCGTSTKVPGCCAISSVRNMPRWPPASAPWAMMASAPFSSSQIASLTMVAEAGGHRGMFLTDNIAEQPGTFALVPQVVDAVKVPVIAAGGIADGRGIAAAFALGASGVQIGSAYLRCPESTVIAPARTALAQALDDSTVITNVMTGRPARGVANRVMREVGPISPDAPAFPHAATGLAPLKAAAEKLGKVDFTNLWAGQAGPSGPRNARRGADPGA